MGEGRGSGGGSKVEAIRTHNTEGEGEEGEPLSPVTTHTHTPLARHRHPYHGTGSHQGSQDVKQARFRCWRWNDEGKLWRQCLRETEGWGLVDFHLHGTSHSGGRFTGVFT